MSDPAPPHDPQPLSDKLNAETARVRWAELERHFAAGRLVFVAVELDLVDVAAAFGADDSRRVRRWMDAGQLAALSDAQARQWATDEPELWAVVVRPWVLVQAVQAA